MTIRVDPFLRDLITDELAITLMNWARSIPASGELSQYKPCAEALFDEAVQILNEHAPNPSPSTVTGGAL